MTTIFVSVEKDFKKTKIFYWINDDTKNYWSIVRCLTGTCKK